MQVVDHNVVGALVEAVHVQVGNQLSTGRDGLLVAQQNHGRCGRGKGGGGEGEYQDMHFYWSPMSAAIQVVCCLPCH